MCKQLLKIIFSSCKLWLTHETFGNLLTSLLCSCALSQTLLSPQSFERHFYGVFQWKLVVCLMKVLLNCVWERKMSPFLISWKMSPFGSFFVNFPREATRFHGFATKSLFEYNCIWMYAILLYKCNSLYFQKKKINNFLYFAGQQHASTGWPAEQAEAAGTRLRRRLGDCDHQETHWRGQLCQD